MSRFAAYLLRRFAFGRNASFKVERAALDALARIFHAPLGYDATLCAKSRSAFEALGDIRAKIKTALRFCFSPHELERHDRRTNERRQLSTEWHEEYEKCGLGLRREGRERVGGNPPRRPAALVRMGGSLTGWLRSGAVLLAMAGALRAQVLDDPVAVPVHFQGQFDAIATGDPQLPAHVNIFAQGVGSSSAAAYGESAGGTDQMTSGGFARLRPGRTYLFEVGTHSATHLRVKVTPPSGHRVFINGVEHEMFEWAMAAGAPLSPQGFFSVRLDDGSSGAAGEAASLRPGRLLWSVALGNLRNGKPAGSLRLAEDNLTANTFRPAALYFDRDSGNLNGSYVGEDGDTVVVKVNNILRQVYATTVLADIVASNDHAFSIRLFARGDVPSSADVQGVYDLTGKTPLYEFLIENPGHPALDTMRITKTVNHNGTLTMWTEMTKSTPAAGATQWLVQDWVDKLPGTTTVSSPVRHRWTYTDGDRNEHLRIEDGAGTVARTVFKRYEDRNFGVETTRELYYEVQGGNPDPLSTPASVETGNFVKTTYTYHTTFSDANAGNWHKVATVDSNDGARAIFSYRNEFQSRGFIFEVRKPHKDTVPSSPGAGSSGEITSYSYDFLDGFGTKRLPTRIETQIDGKTTARSDCTYAYEFVTDSSATYDSGNELMALTVATRKDYYNDTQYLTTVTRVYSEDADPQYRFFPGLLHSTERPDKTMTAMLYFRADFQANSPFFVSTTGGARVHVALQGTSDTTMGTPFPAYGVPAQPVPASFRIVAGKSTEVRTLLGIAGLPMIAEHSAYVNAGIWVVMQQDWANYVNTIWPSSTQRRSGASGSLWDVVSNTWSAARLISTVDETGINQTFGYDTVGRVQAITRLGATGAGTTIATHTISQVFDAAGGITSRSTTNGTETLTSTTAYDTAGRVTSQSAPGQGTTSIAYNVTSRVTTVTLPTTFSQVETKWLDGRTASFTGTAVIAEHREADVEMDGRRKATGRARSSSDVRKQDVWTDWLGRPVRRERPGFNGSTTFTETMAYDSLTGQLTTETKSGYSDTVFRYNGMGERIRSGLDLNGQAGLQEVSTDRIGDSDTSIENYDGAYWVTARAWVFHLNNVDAKVLTGVTRQRLTGLSPTLRAETRTWDADNNETRRTVTVDTAGKLVTVTTSRPGMANAMVEVSLNGFAVSTTGHDGLTIRQTYDALGRLQSVIDPRTGSATSGTFAYQNNTSLVYQRRDASNRVVSTTIYDNAGRPNFSQDAGTGTIRTTYNARGQVEYRWGSAGYPVSYVYDDYGQRTHQRTYRDPNSMVANYWEATSWPGGAVGAADTEWEYDAYTGLLKKKYDPSRQFVEYTYNDRGQTAQRFWARTYNGQRVTATYTYLSGTGEFQSIGYNDTTPTVSYGTYTRLGQPTSVTDYTGARSFDYIDAAAPWRLTSETLSASFYGARKLASLYETTTSPNTGDGTYNGHTIGAVNGRYGGFRLGTNPTPSSYDLEQTYATSSADRLAGLVAKRANGTGPRQSVYGYEPNSSLLKTLSVVGNAFFVTRSFEPNRDLMTQIDTRWSGATRTSYAYQYNDLRQRSTAVQSGSAGEAFEDLGATHQRFTYNPRGEITSARSYHGGDPASTANPLSARLHGYDHDAIGNRKWSNASGDSAVRDDYTVNDQNQYTQRENNTLAVGGTAAANARVAVSGPMPAPTGGQVLAGRPAGGNYWGGSLVVANETGPFSGNVTAYAVLPGAGAGGKDLFRAESKDAWLPPAWQTFTHDADGNLTSDGLWTYDWDAENRLIRMTTTIAAANAGRPNRMLEFRYDYRHRRVEKQVLEKSLVSSPWSLVSHRRFLYDGWNLIAEMDGTHGLKRSYVWGIDLSGSTQGAGGVGGLLQIHDYDQSKTMFPAYDGNGNIAALVNADTGVVEASYEYSPFGELQRCAGAYASANPFRFSSKWQDDETGLVYYGVRYYSPREGRFIGRDPIEEQGGLNLYGFCGNDGINHWDYLGQSWLSSALRKLGKWISNHKTQIIAAAVGILSGGVAMMAMGIGNGTLAGAFAGMADQAIAWNFAVAGGVSGFTSGVTAAKMNGASWGQALKVGAIGGAVGAAMGYLGYQVRTGIEDWLHDTLRFYRVDADPLRPLQHLDPVELAQDQVRGNVTIFENGILNHLKGAVENGWNHVGQKSFILAHNESHGFIADIVETGLGKLTGTSSLGRHLAEVLKQINPSDSSLYLHSQGAQIGINALQTLAQQSLKLPGLQVHSYGGATNLVTSRLIVKSVGAKWAGWVINPFDAVPNLVGMNALFAPHRFISSLVGTPFLFTTPKLSPHSWLSGGLWSPFNRTH